MATDVLITEDVWGEPFERLAASWSVTRSPSLWDDPQLPAAVESVRALVVRNRTRVSADLLASAPALRVIARAGVGLDNIDVAAADRLDIVVSAPLGANAVSVAEHTLGLALALSRHTLELDRESRAGRWNRRAGRELSGGTWGLLGAGATARACGRLASALGMSVLAYDPYLDPADSRLAAAGIRLASLDEVIARADVLSCHLPATEDTNGLVDSELLAGLASHAILINVGRGEVIDEDALADALENGRLGGAALDVRAVEPPELGRLEALDHVILTPHIAGITDQSQERILEVLAHDIEAVLSGAEAASAVGAVKAARR
ncbi:hypothetical protein GCM10027568_23480 [Humibacter soli]